MSSIAGRKLTDLRVADLKDELEKRSLEVTGNKITLVERLQKALKDEGENPDTYVFGSPNKRIPAKKVLAKTKTEEPALEVIERDADDDDVMVVDEVGTVDEEENEAQDNDGDMNDNEESLNLTIGEDEQQLLHAQAQDGKDDKDEAKAEDDHADSGNSNGVIKIKEEVVDETEEAEETEAVEENADEGEEATDKDAEVEGDGADENAGEEDKKDDSEQDSTAKAAASGKEDKDKAAANGDAVKKAAASSSRNLWVSGLSSLTRASDLKTIFSKYGKVIGAKIVTNTRTPGTRCYGYVTMASSLDASRCIENLHRTELHGRIISVERTKSEIGSSNVTAAKKDEKAKPETNEIVETNEETAATAKDEVKEPKKTSDKANSLERKKSDANTSRKESRERGDRKPPIRSISRSRRRSPLQRPPRRSLDRDRKRDVLSFQKIREERERQRMREREREMREEERRRREIRRRQREEEERLAREREKLRMERERLEREKAELLRLERERHKLEREKLEMERLELKRQQMKILQRNEDTKRNLKRPAADDRYSSSSHTETKRSNTDRRFEAPPPPRFDSSLARPADKKRDDYSSSKRDDYKRDIDATSRHSSSNYHSSRDSHKESRYSIPDPPRTSFRRDDRESRTSGGKRYESSSYVERSSGGGSGGNSSWHNSGPPAIKSFAASQMTNNVPSWQNKASESSSSHWPSQDRYDRTYNERSGPYMDPSPRQSGMFVGSGGRPQDRYGGGQISRYENGKY